MYEYKAMKTKDQCDKKKALLQKVESLHMYVHEEGPLIHKEEYARSSMPKRRRRSGTTKNKAYRKEVYLLRELDGRFQEFSAGKNERTRGRERRKCHGTETHLWCDLVRKPAVKWFAAETAVF